MGYKIGFGLGDLCIGASEDHMFQSSRLKVGVPDPGRRPLFRELAAHSGRVGREIVAVFVTVLSIVIMT